MLSKKRRARNPVPKQALLAAQRCPRRSLPAARPPRSLIRPCSKLFCFKNIMPNTELSLNLRLEWWSANCCVMFQLCAVGLFNRSDCRLFTTSENETDSWGRRLANGAVVNAWWFACLFCCHLAESLVGRIGTGWPAEGLHAHPQWVRSKERARSRKICDTDKEKPGWGCFLAPFEKGIAIDARWFARQTGHQRHGRDSRLRNLVELPATLMRPRLGLLIRAFSRL
ncbi:hypothetical protein IWZ01DRAFT_37830 [Phyllosticta capitalensis]